MPRRETSGTKREQAPTVGRCRATNKRGEPCRATVVGADGLCSAHSGRQDMRELGRNGGKARRQGVAEQLPEAERESLRQHLRANLEHATVLEAVERSLAGGNESARVAAVKFLADLELYRKDADDCPRCAAMAAEGPAAREKVNEMIARYVEYAVRAELAGQAENERNSSQASRLVRAAVRNGIKGHEDALEAAIRSALGKIIDRIANPVVVDNDVSAEDAARVFEELAEMGLFDERLRGRAKQLAQERLLALRQEHGV